MAETCRVVVAEDHRILREGLRAILAAEGGLEVVAEAADGREAVRAAESHRPDVMLLDLTMPRMNGLEAIPEIKRVSPQTRILVLTVHKTEEYVHSALKAGAHGYVLKGSSSAELLGAIRSVLDGERHLSAPVLTHVIDRYLEAECANGSGSAFEDLSPREREILKLTAEGNRTREIAEQLCISPRTVENHRLRVMKKLGLQGIPALTAYAIRKGMVVT